jgi:uncharacterized membrane protein YvlD (DUF360 family)
VRRNVRATTDMRQIYECRTPRARISQWLAGMHGIGSNTIATWICIVLVVLVILGVLRTLVKPIVAVALIAIILIVLGVLRQDTVAHYAREAVHAVYTFVASLFSAAH